MVAVSAALVLAYHADDEVARVRDEWLAGLAVILVTVLVLAVRRLLGAREDRANWRSRIGLVLALLLAPFAGLGPLLFVLPYLSLPLVTSLGLAVAGVLRRPAREPVLAFVTLAVAGVLSTWALSHLAACIATDACFH